MLVSLGLVYGLPSRGGVAAELVPYRKNLADVARSSQNIIRRDAMALKAWWGKRRGSVDITKVLEAYATLR